MKVSSFRNVSLKTDNKQLNNFSNLWKCQFVGAPGLKFWTSMVDQEELSNVHYLSPYREYPFGWAVDPYQCKLLVESFDFETGKVVVNHHGDKVEFYVV